MKLTAEQIDYVFNYVGSHDIKWYELQVELTDHMVSSMEEIWERDPELTFHQVKYYAENKFVGDSSFKSIEEERTKNLRKEYRKTQLKMVAEYLKFPKIISSVLAVFLVYKGVFYFEDISTYIKILSGILLAFSLFSIINWYRYKKINGKRFLALETAYKMNSNTILFLYSAILLSKSFKESFEQNYLLFIPFCCLWVLGILLIISGGYLINKVVSDIKEQYQLT